jgi:hypothetical protein
MGWYLTKATWAGKFSQGVAVFRMNAKPGPRWLDKACVYLEIYLYLGIYMYTGIHMYTYAFTALTSPTARRGLTFTLTPLVR